MHAVQWRRADQQYQFDMPLLVHIMHYDTIRPDTRETGMDEIRSDAKQRNKTSATQLGVERGERAVSSVGRPVSSV